MSLEGILSSALGIVLFVLGYILTHPEKVERWHSIAARGLSYLSDRAERATVSAGIQAEINTFAKDMNQETLGAMPYGIKIEWTKEAARDTLIQSGEVIVRMRHHSDQPRNMVYAALAYVSKGFLPHGRHYLREELARSADHIMTRKVFVMRNLDDALHLYVSEFLEPEIKNNLAIQEYCKTLEKLDHAGFFTKIFSHQVERLGLRLYPTVAGSDILKETDDFVDFLKRVAEKERGEKIPGGTLFIRPTFGMAIALIAREETLAAAGVGPHLLWISKCWEKKADTVYVCARGQYNVRVAQKIAGLLLSTGRVEKLSESEITVCDPDGNPTPQIVTVLHRKGP